MSSRIKLDVNRLSKEELIYELRVRDLGDGSNLTVVELRTVIRNALQLEKTSLAIRSPVYPYSFAQDSEALLENIETIGKLVTEFSGTDKDSKFKGIVSKIAHSLGRANRSRPQKEDEKTCKADIRLQLLLAFDKLTVKAKSGHRDSTVFDLSVLRHNVDPPGAHSSAVESGPESSDEDMPIKIKPVPVRDWGLKFTGKKGDMSFSSFMERVEDRRRSRGISRALLFRDAVDLFEGDAYTWYNMVKDWATDWESLVELMKEQFLPINFDRDLFEEIKRRSQGDHESIGLYVASMKGLFHKMKQPVSEETQFEIISERIDPYYQPFIAFEKISSITQLLAACRKLDARREIAKSFTPPPPKSKSLIPELAYASTSSSTASASNSRESTYRISEVSGNDNGSRNDRSAPNKSCWNCGGTGHLSSRCPRPQERYCYSCGFRNVTISPVSYVLDYVLAHARDDERPYVTVSIFGKSLLGLLDSGASRTIIGAKGWNVLKSIGLVNLEKSDLKSVSVANGNSCNCIGILRAPVRLRDIEKIIDILVVPELKHTLILGIDFWSRMGIVPNISSNEWKFSGSDCINVDSLEALNPRSTLTKEQAEILNRLIDETFEKMGDQLGRTNMVEHKIEVLNDVEPIKQRFYPVSPTLMKHIDSELQEMLQKDVIEPSTSPWSSPIVMVRKKDNSFRFCVDYRKLNGVTKRDAYPLPFVTNILDRLRDARYLSSLDIKSAYWQISVEKNSRPYTAFTVPGRGLFQFKRLPFGLHTAPATWQRLIDRVLGVDLEPFVFVYLDDIVIVTQTFEKHVEVLSKVFARLISAGLTLGKEKCDFCRSELLYLGYVVDVNGLHVDPGKVNAILQIPTPTKVSDVRSIIGTASWYRRFIPNFSSLIQPLTELLKKNVKFYWTSRQDEALKLIKEHLISAPVLSCPNFDLPFVIQTDASAYGIGGILTQNHPDFGEQVICYLSRSLTKQERKYSTTERECLGVLWCIEKLRPYIEGTHFTVITDHWSLRWLNNLKDPTGRLARWAIRLQQYSFDIIHRTGKDHVVPDMLSRSVPVVDRIDTEIRETDVGNEGSSDTWYLKMRSKIESDPLHFPSWRVVGSILYKYVEHNNFPGLSEAQDNWKRVIPKDKRKQVLIKCHDDPCAGHPGIFKTFARISQHYYWPKMKADIAKYVRGCVVCCKNKPEQKKPAGLLAPRRVVDRPFQVVSCDLIGPLPRSNRGFRFILVIVDSFSKFSLVIPLRNATSKLVCTAVEDQLFLLFGQPEALICDNGTQLRSREFRKLLESYHVKQVFTANYHAQANPTERANKTLETMIRCYIADNHREWDKNISKLSCAIRTQVHESTRRTPYFIVFGREMPSNVLPKDDTQPGSFDINQSELARDRSEAFQKLYADVKRRLTRASEKNKRYYDLRHRDVEYEIGSRVYRKNFVLSDAAKHYSSKLAPKYVGPFIVIKKVSPWTYELKDMDGRFRGTWHAKDLKPSPEQD